MQRSNVYTMCISLNKGNIRPADLRDWSSKWAPFFLVRIKNATYYRNNKPHQFIIGGVIMVYIMILLLCGIGIVTCDIIQIVDEKERRIAKERAEAAYYGET